jgi:hypothetical protein
MVSILGHTLRSPEVARHHLDVAFGTSLLQRECAASAARSSTVHAISTSTAIKHQLQHVARSAGARRHVASRDTHSLVSTSAAAVLDDVQKLAQSGALQVDATWTVVTAGCRAVGHRKPPAPRHVAACGSPWGSMHASLQAVLARRINVL